MQSDLNTLAHSIAIRPLPHNVIEIILIIITGSIAELEC